MRRKIFISLVLCFAAGMGHLQAQPVLSDEQISRGISLYNFGHWTEARAELMTVREKLSSVRDRITIEKIDYYLALCDVELKRQDMASRLKRYLAEYHGSSYINDIQFALGAYYCMESDDEQATEELSKVHYDRLDPQRKDKYNLRMGYMAFKQNDYAKAEEYFSRIASGGDYADHATYYKSYMAYTAGRMDDARRGFTSLLNSAMYRDLMPFYVMQIDFKAGDYRAVVSKGDALLKSTTDEQAVQIERMMSESWFQLEDFASAIKYMENYKARGGEMGRVENYILGYSLYRQARYAEAAESLRAVAGADDILTQNASYHLADCYLRNGDKRNAMHSFAMASSDSYDAAIAEDALFNYGKLQYELGGGVFNEAINVLTRYIDMYPSSERVGEARTLLIAAYYNSNNYAEAYDAIKSIANPNNDELLALQKIAYFNGLQYYSLGELDSAEASFKESLSASSNAKFSALASFWLGEIAYARGNKADALRHYNNFLIRAPRGSNEYMMAQYNVGYCHFNSEALEDANKAFLKFLNGRAKRDSYRADALNRVGDVHYSARRFDEAIKCYDDAMVINTPERYYAEYQRAVTLGVQNKRKDKINSLQRIVQADRGDYVDAATYELGRTYIADEQYDKGVKTLEQFIGQYPNSKYYSSALSDLGLAYMNLGNKDKALVYYDMVVQASPQSSQSKSAMQGIREIYIDLGNADAYFDYAQKHGLEGNVSQMERDSMSYVAVQKLYLDNKLQEAATGFNNYLNNYPKGYYRADALFFLSDCYIRDKKQTEAIETLQQLTAQGQSQYSERALEKLSSLCYESERWEQAATAFRSLYDVTKTASVRANAASGYVASVLKYANDEQLVAMANDVEKMAEVGAVARRKARYAKAQALGRQGKNSEALGVYELLSTEVKSAEGAEARFRVIESVYNAKNYDKAEKMIYEFSDSNTPQNYWLAKSFILLGDIYMSRNDAFQARATYQSVVDGYSPADDGIVAEAKAKIAKMN
ncbi:MAG: tetratricopeptide repeat protein [Alistipes sp.]|nr:tetratricopeptide repeat protein [Alistipes sp.]